ncbi:MAG: HAD hydrolase-like protein [Alkalispirochaetaceae bacterium]
MISFLLFDLDNTLYSASSGLGEYMNDEMSAFVSELLGVDMTEATALRRKHSGRYGSTLRWLRATREDVDIEAFLERIHPVNVGNYLSYSTEPRQILEALPLPKGVLTNAPREHAERVLEFYRIGEFFDFILDLRADDFRGKPDDRVYNRAVEASGCAPGEILYLDDVLHYLTPFRSMGGQVALVDELGRYNGETDGIPRIASLRELPDLLRSL